MAKKKEKLYTLTQVSKRAGVSMPTLQRYKREYSDRISSVGEGRLQRYPERAIAQVRQIKVENLKKRGRPRKKKAESPGHAKAADLLTLSEVGRRTGISYPTLLRYVKLHLDQIPHLGSGRGRRYPVEAVAVFAALRKNRGRGRPRTSSGRAPRPARSVTTVDPALADRIRDLEKAQKEFARQLDSVIALLKKPIHVTIRSR